MPILCSWCCRMKGADGYPTGERLPMSAAKSHGICHPCADAMVSNFELYRQRGPFRVLRDGSTGCESTTA